MRISRFIVTGGVVERTAEDDGTTRRPWRAEVWIGRSRDGELPFPESGHGVGKRPEVALNRAMRNALDKVRRTR